MKERLPLGGSKGSAANLGKIVGKFCEIKGWDSVTGKPGKERPEALGMKDVFADMWPASGGSQTA